MWFIWWDPCGVICYMFGWATVLYVDYVTVFEVIAPWFKGSLAGWVHATGFQAVIVLILWSYFQAATTDPGAVPQKTATLLDKYPPADDPERDWKPPRKLCTKCMCVKPPRAHHCSTCGRCINRMDHHCPWVNNCVGSNNIKFFFQFILYVFIGATYAAILTAYRAVLLWKARALPPTGTVVLLLISFILAVFFAIFVLAMAWDQYEGVVTNVTGVESLKNWIEENRSVGEGMVDACGEPCGLRWLLPVQLLKDSPSFYKWSETDNKDAYNIRDPTIQAHFQRVDDLTAKGLRPVVPLPGSQPVADANVHGAASGDTTPEDSEVDDSDEDDDDDKSGSEEEAAGRSAYAPQTGVRQRHEARAH